MERFQLHDCEDEMTKIATTIVAAALIVLPFCANAQDLRFIGVTGDGLQAGFVDPASARIYRDDQVSTFDVCAVDSALMCLVDTYKQHFFAFPRDLSGYPDKKWLFGGYSFEILALERAQDDYYWISATPIRRSAEEPTLRTSYKYLYSPQDGLRIMEVIFDREGETIDPHIRYYNGAGLSLAAIETSVNPQRVISREKVELLMAPSLEPGEVGFLIHDIPGREQ